MARRVSTLVTAFVLCTGVGIIDAVPGAADDTPLPYLVDRAAVAIVDEVPTVPGALLPVPPEIPLDEIVTTAALTQDGSAVVFTTWQVTKYLVNESVGALSEAVYRLDEGTFADEPAGGWADADRWRVEVTDSIVFHDRVTGLDTVVATEYLDEDWTNARIHFVDVTPDGRYAGFLVEDDPEGGEGWSIAFVVADRVLGNVELVDSSGYWLPVPVDAGISDDGSVAWWVVDENHDPRGHRWNLLNVIDRADDTGRRWLRIDDFDCTPTVGAAAVYSWVDLRGPEGMITEPPDVRLLTAPHDVAAGGQSDYYGGTVAAVPPAWIDEQPIGCGRGGNDAATVVLTEHADAIQDEWGFVSRGDERALAAVDLAGEQFVRIAELSLDDVFTDATFGSDGRRVNALYRTPDGHRVVRADLDATVPACHGVPATIEATEPGMITGTLGDDVIVGSTGTDSIMAGGGDDLICSGAGADIVNAGPGDDWVDGGPGDDILRGKAGDDVLHGSLGDDRTIGSGGADVLFERFGTNRLSGGGGDDRLETLGEGTTRMFGNSGDDVVTSALGADRLYGGPGIDVLYSGRSDDVVNGGGGDDLLDDLTLSWWSDMPGFDESAAGGRDVLRGGAGNDVIRAGEQMFGGAGDDAIVALWSEVDDAQGYGGDGNDVIDFSALPDAPVFGGDGDDVIIAGLAWGNAGYDILTAASDWHPATLYGGPGGDTITGGRDDDYLVGHAGADVIRAGPGSDLVSGGGGPDTLFGDEGPDTINGGSDYDQCYVDPAEDLAVVNCEEIIGPL